DRVRVDGVAGVDPPSAQCGGPARAGRRDAEVQLVHRQVADRTLALAEARDAEDVELLLRLPEDVGERSPCLQLASLRRWQQPLRDVVGADHFAIAEV